MNVTNMINKVMEDYKNKNLVINESIRYRFIYNGYQTDVFYTQNDGLQNQLLVAIIVNETSYLTTLYFSKDNDNQYFMNYYMPSELYRNVKFTLLYVNDKCSPTAYFDRMQEAILSTHPIVVNHRENFRARNFHHYNDITDNPFFETIVRKPMSYKMIEKIKSKYDNNVAKQIIMYCGKTKTLRFTSDISRSKDILTYIKEEP